MATDSIEQPLALASEPWFEQARLLTATLPSRPGLSVRLQFDATDDTGTHHRWQQVIEDGRIVTWQTGEVDRPDLELRFALPDARAFYRQERSGTEVLAAVRVVEPGGKEGPPPPLDILETAELAMLPEVPGATLVVQFEISDGPFGDVLFWERFDDGRMTATEFGTVDERDVLVGISFQRMVRVRTGEMTILECLENGGRIDGALGPLMLLAGIQESPELHTAELACGPAGVVLARLGEIAASPEHRVAMAALAGVTA